MNSKVLRTLVLTFAVIAIFLISAFSVVTLNSSATSAAPSFTPAINLSNDNGKAQEPNIQNSGSNVYVAWTEGNKGILFRSSPDNGTTWNPPLSSSATRLSPKGGTTQYPLMTVFGPDVFVVWSQSSGSGSSLQVYIAASTNYGATFSPAVLVDPSPGTTQITPVVAAYGSDVYVAWTANGASVVAASTNNGASFGPAFQYSFQHEPQLAASGSYAYAVADGGALYISSNNGATWHQVFIAGCCGAEPWIQASGSNVIVAWETKGSSSQVYVASSQNDGMTWTNPTVLSSQEPDSWAPMVGIQGNTMIVAWRTNPGGSLSEEYVASSTNGGVTWGNAIAIGIDHNDNEWPFTVSISDGNTFIMWSEKTNTITSSSDWQTLVAYSSDNGTTWTSPISLTNSQASGAHPEQDIATGAISSFGTQAFSVWEDNASTPQIYFSAS